MDARANRTILTLRKNFHPLGYWTKDTILTFRKNFHPLGYWTKDTMAVDTTTVDVRRLFLKVDARALLKGGREGES